MTLKSEPEKEHKVPIRLKRPSKKVLDDAASIFLHVTRSTVPYGYENAYYGEMLRGLGFLPDKFGNWGCTIGESDTVFMCHLDTCDSKPEVIVRVINEELICKTDGTTILGADDRAGLAILLYMHHKKVPGTYYLFHGEERGCIGSREAAKAKMLDPSRHKRCISFDRKGYTSVITKQCGKRTCSDKFAQEVADAFNAYGFKYAPDSGGLFTDSKEFREDIAECTNLSVGYFAPHSNHETQDLQFLNYLAETCTVIDWASLGTYRDPSVEEKYVYEPYKGGNYYNGDDDSWYSRQRNRQRSEYARQRNATDELNTYGYSAGGPSPKDDKTLVKTLEACDRIAEAFVTHKQVDFEDIQLLVKYNTIDTLENIEVLLETLHNRIEWQYPEDEPVDTIGPDPRPQLALPPFTDEPEVLPRLVVAGEIE